jgi:hypothetical protein
MALSMVRRWRVESEARCGQREGDEGNNNLEGTRWSREGSWKGEQDTVGVLDELTGGYGDAWKLERGQTNRVISSSS